LLIFFVGAAYFSPTVGLIAAALLTFSPWAIQQAHFDTTETMLVFFLLLLLLSAKKITTKRVLCLGLVWGLAMAAKSTSLLFGVIPLSAIWLSSVSKNIFKKLLFTFLLGTVTTLFFFIFSPYTILDFKHFMESMTYESGVALGRFTVPYTLQFVRTPPYLYQLQTMIWQAGPLVVVGILGFIGLVITAICKKKIHLLPLVIFPLLYFGWVGSWFAKFNRYNVPFLPFVTIAAAWACVLCIQRFRRIGITVTALLLCITVFWGLANWTVYIRPNTFLTASRWMYAHVPDNAQLYTEHWNDGLPIDLPDVGFNSNYRRESLTVYEPDNADKKIYYADKLVMGNFIILSTRRIWATMPRLGEKYPLTKLFYQRLLDGSLGYTEVGRFTSYPQLFGIAISDDAVEETIQVYDHPTVLIFQNVGRYTREQFLKLLTP
jgi:hypothetical protein